MGTECPEERLKRVIKQRNVTGRADGRRVNKANVKKKNGNSTAVIPREETHCQGGILPKKKKRHPPFPRKRSTGHVLGFFLFFGCLVLGFVVHLKKPKSHLLRREITLFRLSITRNFIHLLHVLKKARILTCYNDHLQSVYNISYHIILCIISYYVSYHIILWMKTIRSWS